MLQSVDFPHSIGLCYTAFTQLLGFPHYGDEYKVMGMAPYGTPTFMDKLEDVVRLTDDGLLFITTPNELDNQDADKEHIEIYS